MKKRKMRRALSFLMTVLMATSLFANGAVLTVHAAAGEPITLYDLNKDSGLAGGTMSSTAVVQSGGPTIAVVQGTNGPSLHLTNVKKSYDAVDLKATALKQSDGSYLSGDYTFTVKGHVDAGVAADYKTNNGADLQMVLGMSAGAYSWFANQTIDPNGDGTFTLSFTKTYTSADFANLGYNFRIQKNGDGTSPTSFYVDEITVTEVPTPVAAITLYDLNKDSGLAGGTMASTAIQQSGGPTIAVVEGTNGPSLHLTNVKKSYDAVDLKTTALKQSDGSYLSGDYTFTVKGHVDAGVAADYKTNNGADLQMVLGMSAGSYSWFDNKVIDPAGDGTFTLSFTKAYTSADFANLGYDFRIQKNGDSTSPASFYVDEITVKVVPSDGQSTPPPPVTSTIGTHAPDAGTNLITESTFEDGLTTGWAGRAGTEQLSVVADPANASNHALQVTGRTANWNGPKYELIEKVKAGSYYNVSLKVKAAPGQSGAKTVNVSYQTTVNGSPTYPGISGTVAISDTQWTTVTGEMSLADATNSMTQLSIYVQSDNVSLSYLIDDVSVVEDASRLPQPVQMDIPNLKDVYKDYFTLGGEVEPAQIQAGTSTEQLVSKHYGILVPGNEMKPSSLEATKGTWTWGPAEQVIDYAKAHNLPMRGHTLVWHSQVPDWLFQDPSDATKTATHDQLIASETEYIRGVLTHLIEKYGTADGNTANGLNPTGKVSPIKYFDTVNEVVDDNTNNGTYGYRNSKWYQISGLDYIRTAFRVAHEMDPSLQLYINDYNTENNGSKTDVEYNLIKQLIQEGVPVGGVGMQMHMNVNTDINAVKASIEKFASLGLPIQITELDLRTNENPVTQNGWAKQALVYKQLFDMLKTEKNKVTAVLFWGTTDADSWLKPDEPLIFSAQYQAKPAYWAIVDPSKATVARQNVQAVNGTPADTNDFAWSTVKPISVNTFAKGSNGATATVRTMWDSKNLYVKATVADATVGSKDSIDMYVDKANSKAASYEPNDNYKHITVKRSEAVSDANGYTAYVTIPLDGITPAENMVLGFDARVNDDHGNGTVDSQAVLNDFGNRQDTNAAYFANLKLGAASKIAKAIYGTPTVDGTVESLWNDANEVRTDIFVMGTSGATAKVKTMWDEHNLYVLAQVTDSVLNKASANVWEQDSVEIFVDQNNGKTTSYQSDDSQIRVNFDNLVSSGGNMPEGFVSATSKTETGYIVEMAIPFNKVAPAAGNVIGFDAQVNNADSNGARVSAATWNDASGNGYQNTSGFGNLLLMDKTLTIIDAIDSAKAGDNVTIPVDQNTVVDKSVFDALKGQDKTVTFVSDGATWTFNGKDMKEATKSVDLSVKIEAAKDSTSANKDAILAEVQGKDAVIISFAENGVLPGPATVTVNLGSNWANNDSVYFYYYNPTTKAAELVAGPVKADANGNITVTVAHNSDYFVTKEKLAAAGSNTSTNTNTNTNTLPKTGSVIDFNVIILIGLSLMAAGVVVFKKRRIEE